MSWMPYYTHHCIKCKPRTEAGELPYCVKNCPNKALAYGAAAAEKIDAAMGALQGRRDLRKPR
jgi:Fe-S-cluster-containing dehydrogenase component